MTIRNNGKKRVEQSLTLLQQESVIPLDDSIWSVFEVNPLSVTNHFYFIPRTDKSDITVLFHTEDSHLYITSRIFNTKTTPNPLDWPFQHAKGEHQSTSDTQEVVINKNDPALKECWPHCAILINMNEAHGSGENTEVERTTIKSYKLMATNSVFELP